MDPISKIGLYLSRNLTLDNTTSSSMEIARIVELHNKLIEKINLGEYTTKDFYDFRGVIAKEKVKNSEFVINLCMFLLESSDALFLKEFTYLHTTGFLTDTSDNTIKYIAENIRDINRKIQSFTSKFIDCMVNKYEEYNETQFLEYQNLLAGLNTYNSPEYQLFCQMYRDFINTTFLTPEFKTFLMSNCELILNKTIALLKIRMFSCGSHLDAEKDKRMNERKAMIKNIKALKQLK